MIAVEDPDDPRLEIFRRNERGLTNRAQRSDGGGDGLFLAEGDLVVERALEAGCVPVIALVDADRAPVVTAQLVDRVDVFAGGAEVRRRITGLGTPLGIVALFERPRRPSVEEVAHAATHVVVIEAVDNPANVGAIVRNAMGLGWHGLVFDSTSADPLLRRALRVSMGHALHLPHARASDLPAALHLLRDRGFSIVALTPGDGGVDLADVSAGDKVAVLLGAERTGLSVDALAASTHQARIPMSGGVDSLNVAAASAIACYALCPPT